MKEIIGFALVILSAIPMGLGEGKIIDMEENYTMGKIVPTLIIYFFGVFLYLLGFMQIPTKIGFVIGIWEITAVTISVSVAISKRMVTWDRELFVYYLILIGATYILGFAADRIFMKAGIE